jgi:hypothetical protein
MGKGNGIGEQGEHDGKAALHVAGTTAVDAIGRDTQRLLGGGSGADGIEVAQERDAGGGGDGRCTTSDDAVADAEAGDVGMGEALHDIVSEGRLLAGDTGNGAQGQGVLGKLGGGRLGTHGEISKVRRASLREVF